MSLVSTGGSAAPTDLRTALFHGLAPDGGLYLPSKIEPLESQMLGQLKGAPLSQIAEVIAEHLLGNEFTRRELETVARRALDFETPLVRVQARLYGLELFHGPTLAFKDVGARFMSRLMMACRQRSEPPLTVLVATSGDTGGAVAHAFLDAEGFRVVVLYPAGQVSSIQERQFTTLNGNVQALAIQGNFDDCQRLVKEAFADEDLQARLNLTSANSINIGRLLPQIFYYFYAWAHLPEKQGSLIFSTPSGNFGNLTAGLMAKRLGLPAATFVAATNVNDVVPAFLLSGRYQPRPSVRTISSAMDVGAPSNFARIMALYDNDLKRLRRDLIGCRFDDEETRRCIREVFHRYGYILDPHSAVGYLGLAKQLDRNPEAVGVFIATAHPAKFRDIVEPIIDRPLPLPDSLAVSLARTPRYLSLSTRYEELKEVLTSGPVSS